MTENIITEKTCSRCKNTLPISAFWRKGTKTHARCIDCTKWLRKHPESLPPIENLPNEEWRECVENTDYAISNMGRIKRIKFHQYTRNHEYLVKPRKNANGYLCVNILLSSDVRVHRLVCRAFHGEPLPGQTDVNHIDNDRTNNCADNLHWCTRKENLHWGKQQGRDNTGERNGQAKLTEDIVKQIVHLLKTTDQPITHIARDFGIAQANVSFINLGKRWKYLTKDEILPLRK